MTDLRRPASSLLSSLDEALDLLKDYKLPQDAVQINEPLPNLLEQCERLLAISEAVTPEPVRTVHHFACTGGTLIAKCISALPNTVLLSEIDPLSAFYKDVDKKKYSPSDIIFHVRNSLRNIDDDVIVDMFVASISNLHDNLKKIGKRLVIRDHTHSHYCSMESPESRPTLQNILKYKMPALSLVTVRHPVDSYLSLISNKWKHFSPFNIEEYSRRYMLFLDDYSEVPIVHYEDFVKAPEPVMENICSILGLPYTADVFDLLDMVVLSGDSGRSSNVIAVRPRREVPESIRIETLDSPTYNNLCKRLCYNPDVDAEVGKIT
ncbi:MAG: sulfotransferase [Asticcacaulis sp.]